MRGVVSAGMVWALEDLGLTHAFDAIYGASAGAFNAAYFLARQAGLGATIYLEDINTRAFIDFARPLRGRPIVDLAYLLDDVARRRKRLDVDRVLTSPTSLSVLATDVDRRESVTFGAFATSDALFGALRAGATMPVVAGGPFEFDGRRFLDASLSEPIPLAAAETGGHTHVVALLTRNGVMRPRPSAFDRYYVGPRLRAISPELAARYLARSRPYAATLEAIDSGLGFGGSASVLGIRAAGPPVARLERRRPVLAAAAQHGYDAVMAVFGDARSAAD